MLSMASTRTSAQHNTAVKYHSYHCVTFAVEYIGNRWR